MILSEQPNAFQSSGTLSRILSEHEERIKANSEKQQKENNQENCISFDVSNVEEMEDEENDEEEPLTLEEVMEDEDFMQEYSHQNDLLLRL